MKWIMKVACELSDTILDDLRYAKSNISPIKLGYWFRCREVHAIVVPEISRNIIGYNASL